MTEEEQALHECRNEIQKLPAESQKQVVLIAATIRHILQIDPKHGGMALALVGLEFSAAP